MATMLLLVGFAVLVALAAVFGPDSRDSRYSLQRPQRAGQTGRRGGGGS